MNDSTPADAFGPPSPTAEAAAAPPRRPFLTTHAAIGASTREFARLTAELLAAIARVAADGPPDTPKVRSSPYRTIVQMGRVAVTLAWLRDRSESAEAGQLLVVVWHGAIAGTGSHQFERPEKAAIATAAVVWEGAYRAEAENEQSWRWRSQGSDGAPLSSAEVAGRCAAELVRAYASA